MVGNTEDKSESGYASVVERFPEYREIFKRLFESSPSFQTLCEEYEDCLRAMRYWRESSFPEAPEFRNEFSSLLRELEEEILENVHKQRPD
jgi:hypothetical protein